MGKGDQRSKRGKIIVGSYGVKRKKRTPGEKFTAVKKVANTPESPKKVVVETPVDVHVDMENVAADESKVKAPKKKAVAKSKAATEDMAPEEHAASTEE